MSSHQRVSERKMTLSNAPDLSAMCDSFHVDRNLVNENAQIRFVLIESVNF